MFRKVVGMLDCSIISCLVAFVSLFNLQSATCQVTYTDTCCSRFSIQGGFANHIVGLPIQNLFSAYNPAIADVGIGFRLNKKTDKQIIISSQTSFICNSVIGNTLFTGLGIGFQYTNKTGIIVGLGLHSSGVLQFIPNPTYSFNGSVYEATKLKPQVFSAIGYDLNIGYDFSNKFDKRYALFIRNKFILQSPYFDIEAFGIMPQNLFEMGFIYKMKSRK